jgi:murein DD-endopeptidase MepM/ murein hydrolase activator NlpD
LIIRTVAGAVALALLIGVFGAPPVTAFDCDPGDTICFQLKQAQAAQEENRHRLEHIQQEIQDVQQRMRELAAYIRQLNDQIAAQRAKIRRTQQRIAELDRQIRIVQADIARREAHLKVREELLGQRVRSMDKHGSVNYLELLFTSANFNQLIDRVLIMQEIIRSDHKLIDELREERAQVQKLRDELAAKRQEQLDLLKQQKEEEAQLEQTRRDQQDALAYQRQLEAQFQAQREELEREQAAIDGQVHDLQARYDAEAAAYGGGNGVFRWPEDSRYITQGFGCTDLLGEPYNPNCPSLHWHTGIDLGGPWGANIYAADAGVASVFPGAYGYGNYLIITHGNGWSTLYGHLSSYAVGDGAFVRRGQVVAYEGSTGFSTGPHLHFEIRYNGTYQNPCAYLGC